MELEPIFIVAIIFGFTYAIVDLFVKRKERMAIIEKGIDAPSFNTKPKKKRTVRCAFFYSKSVTSMVSAIL